MIENEEFRSRSKAGRVGAFTRNRALTFKDLLVFIMRGGKSSLQRELDSFFKEVTRSDFSIRRVTKGAFSTAPVNHLTTFKLETHFETGKGYAINGQVKGEEVTIFRFDSTLNHIFVTLGRVTDRPRSRNACRTQLEVELSPSAIEYFTEHPFGNHHMVLPGNWAQRLTLAAELLNIGVVR